MGLTLDLMELTAAKETVSAHMSITGNKDTVEGLRAQLMGQRHGLTMTVHELAELVPGAMIIFR